MPSNNRRRARGRRESAPFLALPEPVTGSANYCKLSNAAVRMLIELGRQSNGKNNGDLAATLSILGPRGWSSNDTITRALRELEYFGFIIRTRQGGRNQCSLYALGWKAIDDCDGKLEISSSVVPVNGWKIEKPTYQHQRTRLPAAACSDS